MSMLGQIMQQQVFVQSGWYQRQSGVLLPLEVREILRKYNGTAIIPGAAGTGVYGFAPGNYVESTGQTLSPVDGKVGLVVDSAGSVGPELWSNDLPLNGTISAGWSYSGGVISTNGTQANFSLISTASPAIPIADVKNNTSYQVEFTITGAGYIGFGVGEYPNAAGGTLFKSAGTYSMVVRSGDYGMYGLRVQTGGGSNSLTIHSIRELPGIHASQATDGYKPIERRGLVNLLTYSNDFGNSVWGKNNVTPSSNKIIPSTVSGLHKINQQSLGAGTYTLAAKVKAAGYGKFALWFDGGSKGAYFDAVAGVFGTITGADVSSIDLGNGECLVSVSASFATTGNGPAIYLASDTWEIYWAGDGTSGLEVFGAALFQGTVTAQQILDAGGIPVTTSAPASSTNGVNYLEFDQIDDKLQMNFPTGQGWNAATIVQAREGGAVTLTGQNIEGTYYITGGGKKFGDFFFPSALSVSELAQVQKFANKLAGVV